MDDILNLKPDRPLVSGDDSIVDTRHNGESFIWATQKYNKINTTARTNLSHVAFWPRGSKHEINSLLEDQAMDEGMTMAQLHEHLKRLQSYPQPYDMLWIDKTAPPGEQLRHGIGGPLLSEGDVFSLDGNAAKEAESDPVERAANVVSS
jgi:hypothetical protein